MATQNQLSVGLNIRSSLIADLKASRISVDFPFHINGDMSARMMAILGEMAAGQEVYSIDESFLDVTGIGSLIPLETFGQQMRAHPAGNRADYRRWVWAD